MASGWCGSAENILFSRTVRENIALSGPAMPMEDVVDAARTTGARLHS